MAFVENAWYVAGWSRDFSQELVTRTIVDQDIVLFRKSSSEIVALADCCPHRLLPLSKGKRVGDTVQCGYHGMTFDGTGQCVRVPGQDNLPSNAKVRTFAVVEQNGIVWVWMGDKTQADPTTIFSLPQFADPNWHAHFGDALKIDAYYLNVAENLVDPAHVSFVHPTTLGNAASEDVPVEVSTDGDVITAWRWIRNAPPVGFFQQFGNFSGHVDRWHYYHLHLPSTAVIDFGSANSADSIREQDRDSGVRIFAIHFVTPVDSDRTIDYWMHVRNTATNDDSASELMDTLLRKAFHEDVEILEAIHRSEKRSTHRQQVRIAIDKGPNAYRKRINDLLQVEATAA
ncbi:MAG: aromatic ring-hydroxylating dioxygenase subunit alpha [Aestuariivita sp.]|nr:aromatic ring-hydroxylating dioxygenase subunit alpha [Aestuariivita sp.]MCY4202665.1 aromatic ring-hydroxylating dioxygenase subunit alpha [Aestuariivita sp.]MCY4289855.1 aromatic ring-hydroxylating dioxygenase subunit alpha [Aestuariivita sp.]MCY4348210.1 aromatic ring-hydroxylating dioxygenase subunit alpha [Aestuariivita sp.]